MNNQAGNLRKDLALRSIPGVAGIICLIVAFRMTNPAHATFVLLVSEGIVLFGLAAFLVWRYLKTPSI
jgi:hypothetical protein